MGVLGVVVLIGVLLVVLVGALFAEARRLERAAQRYRELADEGVEEVARADAFPEFAAGHGTVVLPDGSHADRDAILRQELRKLRARQRGERP
jgi:hypothetical protein